MVHSALDVCPRPEQDNIHFNKAFITSIVAINKAVEFMLFMFSFALASHFKAGLTAFEELYQVRFVDSTHARINFHIIVMAMSWLAVIVLLVAYAFNIVYVISTKFRHTFTVLAAVHVFGALIMLIVTSLSLDNVLDLRKYKEICRLASCSSFEGAGATSFFSIISVSFDAALHCIKAMQVYRDHQTDGEANAEYTNREGERNESYEPQEAGGPGAWNVVDHNASSSPSPNNDNAATA